MSSLNSSMISNASNISTRKKMKDEMKHYLQTWNTFYREFDEDRFNKAMISPSFTRAYVAQSRSVQIDRKFIGIFYAMLERYFLNFQMRNIITICNSISDADHDDQMMKIALEYIFGMIDKFNQSESLTFAHFISLHEDLLRLIGWKTGAENYDEYDQQLIDGFAILACRFYMKKFIESSISTTKISTEQINGSALAYLSKFDKDKATIVSTWVKMPVKVLVAKPEKIQLLCDKNGVNKEVWTKIDKAIILVEDSNSNTVHIGYDSCVERFYRFSVQAKAIADEETISQTAVQKSEYLQVENSKLIQRVSSDCQVAREQSEILVRQLSDQLLQIKQIFNETSVSWLKTLGLVKNYIIPVVSMTQTKKQAFIDALDMQTEIIGKTMDSFGIQDGTLQSIYVKYYEKKHEEALEIAMTPQSKKTAVKPEEVKMLARKETTQQTKLEQMIYNMDSEDTSQWTIKKAIDEVRLNINTIDCAICCETRKSNQFWHSKCQHQYCFECLRDHISSKVAEGKRAFSDLTCCMCDLMLEPKEVYAILSPAVKVKIDDFYANRILNFSCPNEKCGKMSFISEKTLALSEGFITNCCGQHVCSKCKSKFHESRRCPSQTKELIESVEAFRSNQKTDAGRMFRFCPICSQLAFKDEGCNHVKCIKCHTEFCFQCSAPRQPILGHGNHYHRKGCPDFAEYIHQKTKKPVDLEHDVKKCTACNKTKKPCKRPAEWNDFNNSLLLTLGSEIFDAFPDNFCL